jgi:hypothetical protein
LSRVGPGLITGVADDDPSGIATYSQAGAQFGFNLLWMMPLSIMPPYALLPALLQPGAAPRSHRRHCITGRLVIIGFKGEPLATDIIGIRSAAVSLFSRSRERARSSSRVIG